MPYTLLNIRQWLGGSFRFFVGGSLRRDRHVHEGTGPLSAGPFLVKTRWIIS